MSIDTLLCAEPTTCCERRENRHPWVTRGVISAICFLDKLLSYSMISFNSKGYSAVFMLLPWVKTKFDFRNSAIDIKCLIKMQLSSKLFIIKVTVPSRLLPATKNLQWKENNPPILHFISEKSLKEISLQQYVIFHTGYEMRPVTPCRFYFKHFFSGEAAIIPRFDSLSTWSLITFR